ncbi:tol-pal system protein YbgF [Maritimibacter dapengensis]|uniref:Cell division coordinator CpoB n=1 Tax=Maritimibacter dapengensis TaxID=2836868 RepID=A0ABS6SZI5_9RHOB|nr:tol-pal system protein YbgF [Maritimibacter dapengensis]MBV7378284.1 tol-pal system protein YbgF [Maritimibacter dapengensis]
MSVWLRTAALAAMCGLSAPAMAQDRGQTLADVRQELTVLSVELQRLKTELNTTGSPSGVTGSTTRERVDAIEAALARLTAKTEELEFRVNSVATDGGNRVGDLSFRLCELEADCDVMNEGISKPLGGVEALPDTAASGGMTTPQVTPQEPTDGTQLAVGERADFDAAKAAFDGGNYAQAAEGFQSFVSNYPGTPMAGQAHFLRGEALAAQGQTADAARAYLASFSADQSGGSAPDALLRLGTSLGALGQANEACATLAEVPNRFPSSNAAAQAANERAALGCQ